MTPLRTLHTAARERLPTRRQVLTGAAAFVGAAAWEGVKIAAEKVALDPLLADNVETLDPTSMDQTAVRLASMAGNAIADARDIAAETGGLNPFWWERAARAGVLKYATRVRRREDGRIVIGGHGEGLVLWGEDAPTRMIGVPLDEQPDRKFGRAAHRWMWEAMHHQQVALHARCAETIIKGHDRPQVLEYYALTLSDGQEAVSVALTLEQIAQARSPAISRPDAEGAARPLLSHDATRQTGPSRLASRRPRSSAL